MLDAERSRIRFYLLHVAAAIARMIGKLDRRNTTARMMVQADPSASSDTLV